MTDIVTRILRDAAKTVWNGVNDVFSSAAGALVAIVVAILLSIFPIWVLIAAAACLYIGIVYSQYKEIVDTEDEE